MQRRTAHEPHAGDAHDHTDAHDHIPGVAAERRHLERGGEVVGHEERGERHHDQVVEEERPAGHEPGEVVERPADEGGGAARLGHRRRPLGVGERDEQEEQADAEQHERREPDRVQGDDAEREVDRRGDLAVGDREERPRVELSAEAWELPRHALSPRSSEDVDPAGASGDEHRPEEVAERPAAASDRHGDHRDPEPDQRHREREAERPICHLRCLSCRRRPSRGTVRS